jgi:hypothetical protein
VKRKKKLLIGWAAGITAFLVSGHFLEMAWPFQILGAAMFSVWWCCDNRALT